MMSNELRKRQVQILKGSCVQEKCCVGIYRFFNADYQTYERSCLPWNLKGTCLKNIPKPFATKSVPDGMTQRL